MSYFWNMGSLLGICLVIQIMTGLFLTFHYQASLTHSFESVSVLIGEETGMGWLMRSAHANGASFFFIFIFTHIARGVMFKSFFLKAPWLVGVMIVLLLMGTAFLGYVLPWGQMSFWGATVITNLMSAIPFIGNDLVQWVWGGFSVSEPTLERFFSLHFLLPFILLALSMGHIFLLHSTGSSNPLGVDQNSDKIFFHPLFSLKDILGILLFLVMFLLISIYSPDLFMDPDNFSIANPLSTPPHIQPEWYFLFAYAILRSTPTKLGGVVALLFSVTILFLFPLKKKGFWSSKGLLVNKVLSSLLFSSFFVLTWVGSMPVEYPLESIGKGFSLIYFFSSFLFILF